MATKIVIINEICKNFILFNLISFHFPYSSKSYAPLHPKLTLRQSKYSLGGNEEFPPREPDVPSVGMFALPYPPSWFTVTRGSVYFFRYLASWLLACLSPLAKDSAFIWAPSFEAWVWSFLK